MAKDFNGVEIKVGDTVTHRFEDHPRGDDYAAWRKRMEEENPEQLKFYGFHGKATVTNVGTATAEVENPAMRGRIPVFAGSLLEVVSG